MTQIKLPPINSGRFKVWNEIKNDHLEKEPIKNRADFRQRVHCALEKLKEFKERVKSFFLTTYQFSS